MKQIICFIVQKPLAREQQRGVETDRQRRSKQIEPPTFLAYTKRIYIVRDIEYPNI